MLTRNSVWKLFTSRYISRYLKRSCARRSTRSLNTFLNHTSYNPFISPMNIYVNEIFSLKTLQDISQDISRVVLEDLQEKSLKNTISETKILMCRLYSPFKAVCWTESMISLHLWIICRSFKFQKNASDKPIKGSKTGQFEIIVLHQHLPPCLVNTLQILFCGPFLDHWSNVVNCFMVARA